MNYYEELGIPLTASADEVKRAYRNLARVIHPDTQPDEGRRQLAGLRMARLNGIFEILTDQRRRAEYDRSLRYGPPPPLGGMRVQADGRWRIFEWPMAAAILGFGLLSWWVTQYSSGQSAIASTAEPASASAPRSEDPLLVSERSGPAAADWAAGFAGHWIYEGHGKLADPEEAYPPSYIELDISQRSGQLAGTYFARYPGADPDRSPYVQLDFAGMADLPDTELPWTGSSGSAGHVHLTLLSPQKLRVEWVADKIGFLQIGAGTATLVRDGSL